LNAHNQQVIEEIPMVDNDEKMKETILTSGQKKVVNNVYTLGGNQDFEVFDNFIKNPNGGRPLTEYALSIDFQTLNIMLNGNKLKTWKKKISSF